MISTPGRFVKLGVFAGKPAQIIAVLLDRYHQGIQFFFEPVPA
jgi:hypothetical protein